MRRVLPVRHILIIRLTAVGDIVMSNPVASSLKRQNPNTVITWVVHPDFRALLEDHPDIDHLISFDINRWRSLWRSFNLKGAYRMLQETHSALQAQRFDQAIDLQGILATGIIAWLSDAKHRIALGSSGGNSFFMTKTISRNIGEQTQIGSEYRYLINQLGASDNYWDMHIPETDDAAASAEKALEQYVGGGAYAVISPHSPHPQKRWFDDYWEQIILRVRGRYQLKTIIVGDAKASAAGEKIAKITGAVNLAGKINLLETAAIIRGASLMVGIDNGLTHMGHALKIPTISLFGASYPYAFVNSDTSRIIFLDRFCSPCRNKPICNKKYQCMRDITPDKVLTAIKPLINSSHLIVSQ